MTTKKPATTRQKYQVKAPYQCPNTKHWHQVGDRVELLPSEADFLMLSGKIATATDANKSATKTKGEA
ncbi:hypothetical protein [Marinomonas aquiplantarum]|uniref:Uncharacterized protein n=1 Tax=Marinomonas aquiplantarum TaxID=491951 RepID=A0A366CZG9_9GAMM|nr:hypothetical protein [Marinomonas aquiplantarum]RBO82639.1 hypothetical protein DFP76_105104 [Marinomonas aquiplantarum]